MSEELALFRKIADTERFRWKSAQERCLMSTGRAPSMNSRKELYLMNEGWGRFLSISVLARCPMKLEQVRFPTNMDMGPSTNYRREPYQKIEAKAQFRRSRDKELFRRKWEPGQCLKKSELVQCLKNTGTGPSKNCHMVPCLTIEEQALFPRSKDKEPCPRKLALEQFLMTTALVPCPKNTGKAPSKSCRRAPCPSIEGMVLSLMRMDMARFQKTRALEQFPTRSVQVQFLKSMDMGPLRNYHKVPYPTTGAQGLFQMRMGTVQFQTKLVLELCLMKSEREQFLRNTDKAPLNFHMALCSKLERQALSLRKMEMVRSLTKQVQVPCLMTLVQVLLMSDSRMALHSTIEKLVPSLTSKELVPCRMKSELAQYLMSWVQVPLMNGSRRAPQLTTGQLVLSLTNFESAPCLMKSEPALCLMNSAPVLLMNGSHRAPQLTTGPPALFLTNSESVLCLTNWVRAPLMNNFQPARHCSTEELSPSNSCTVL